MDVQLVEDAPLRTFFLSLKEGEDVVEQLHAFAQQNAVVLASFSGVGAFRAVELGFYNATTGDYDTSFNGSDQFEVASLLGVIFVRESGVEVNPHVVIGQRSAATLGGHLLKGIVRPGLALTVTELAPRLAEP